MRHNYDRVYHLVDKNVFDCTRDKNIWGLEVTKGEPRTYWGFNCNINKDILP